MPFLTEEVSLEGQKAKQIAHECLPTKAEWLNFCRNMFFNKII